MTEVELKIVQDRLRDRLHQVVALLNRHKLADLHASDGIEPESPEQHQNLAELQQHLAELHTADIADILEALPLGDRLRVWALVAEDRGDVLLEVSDAVRESLLADMDRYEILAVAREMDADELADLATDLPRAVAHDLLDSLDAQQRARVHSALSYDEDQVGALMDFEIVSIREDVTLEVVLRYLRRFQELPSHTDKLFVVDQKDRLKGVLPIKRLLLNDPERLVSTVMVTDAVIFRPEAAALEAAQAFDRYDLISAPVVDAGGCLVGRLTIDEMVDLIREASEAEVLSRAGLREDEDIFASVWRSVHNRWTWLAVNLITAFVASRVIGLFDGTIERLVALAALMPIVAGIGGNSGNQTITMIVRALALDQITPASAGRLLRKELGVALINGVIWGGVIGLVAYGLYENAALGVVMMAAMTLNLLLAALMGVLIPMSLIRLGRDPAMGASVMITAVTDSGGFFIFLGLASVFLM